MKSGNGYRLFIAILSVFLILGLIILIWGAVAYKRPPLYFDWRFGPALQSMVFAW